MFEHKNMKAVMDTFRAGDILSGERSALCVCLCVEESEGYGGGLRVVEKEEGRRGNGDWLVAFDKVLEEFGFDVIDS